MTRGASRPRGRFVAVSLACSLLASLIPLVSASAAVAVVTTPANDSNMSADLAGTSDYDTLTGPVISENGAGVISTGTIVLNAPSGFQFKPTTGGVHVNDGCDMVIAFGPALAGSIGANITTASTVSTCVITFTGILVQPTTGVLPNAGDITETGTATGAPTGSYGNLVMVAGAPVLTFTAAPSGSVPAGMAFATQPIVHDADKSGNLRTGDSITISTAPGAFGTIHCTTNPVAVDGAGDATFAGCVVAAAQTGYKLRASTLTSFVDSAPFDIFPGAPVALVFASSPATNTAALLSPQPVVSIVDSLGNIVHDNRFVTLAINQFTGTFDCTGGRTIAAVDGLAAFSGCTQMTVGTNYTLTASAPGVTSATTNFFNVNSGVAGKIALCWGMAMPCVTTAPTPVQAGTPFSLQPVVRVLDSAGNQVPTDTTTVVTIAIKSGTPTDGGPGTLSCLSALSLTVNNGVGAYSGCKIDKLGTGYQIVATASPALTSVTSSAFDVVAGPPAKIAFISQPTSANADSVFGTTPAVAIVDAGGNVVVAGATATIALSLGNNPAAGTLTCSGGASVNTVNGVARFNGCKIDKQGTGYTLSATATTSSPTLGGTTATSAAFDVLAPAASITVTPSKTVITWGETVTLHVHFALNGAAKTFSLQAGFDGVAFTNIATLTTDANGDASFDYRPAINLYYRAAFAGTTDLPGGVSSQARVVVRQISLLRPTGGGHTKTVKVGTVVKFVTTVRPTRPELPVSHVTWVVFQLQKGKWVQIITQHLTSGGGLTSLTLTFSVPGSFYIRSIADPTPVNANSVWSPVERYDVR